MPDARTTVTVAKDHLGIVTVRYPVKGSNIRGYARIVTSHAAYMLVTTSPCELLTLETIGTDNGRRFLASYAVNMPFSLPILGRIAGMFTVSDVSCIADMGIIVDALMALLQVAPSNAIKSLEPATITH